jgi:hypothetical protein
MVIVKASKNSEAGAMLSHQLLTEMGKFNEELNEGRRDAGRARIAAEFTRIFGRQTNGNRGAFDQRRKTRRILR